MPKYNKDEITKYYEILGIDTKGKNLIKKDSINLNNISDLYYLNGFNKKLPYTFEELSNSYALLIEMIKNGFWYDSKKRREAALCNAYEIIDDLSCVMNDVKSEEDIDKIVNLKTTIINGLCSVGDIIAFRLFQKNASFNLISSKIHEMEIEELNNIKMCLGEDNYPDDLKKLYYLMAYSKFNNDGNNLEIFDGLGKVSLINLRHIVKKNINEGVQLKALEAKEEIQNKKILKLSSYQKK